MLISFGNRSSCHIIANNLHDLISQNPDDEDEEGIEMEEENSNKTAQHKHNIVMNSIASNKTSCDVGGADINNASPSSLCASDAARKYVLENSAANQQRESLMDNLSALSECTSISKATLFISGSG